MSISTLDEFPARRGAEILLDVLRDEGVEYIFGNPGTTELPLMDALTRTPDLAYILALQEASAVAMADGYAQAAKRPGFLNLHTAGGLGHGMGNLINAQISQTPLVVTAGQQDSRHTLTDPLLAGDLVSIASPVVKWAREVSHADQLPVLLRRAFHDATAAPSGPVFLSLPMDVMEQSSTAEIIARSTIDHRSVAGSLPELAAFLAAVPQERLAIVAGDEIHPSGAADEVVALAERLGAPVFGSSWPARIPFPTAHPLWSGNLPTTARAIAETLGPFDAIFALGGKSVITILYSEGSAIPAHCDVFQLSADVRDLGRTYVTKLSMVGEIKASLQALAPLLSRHLGATPRRLDKARADREARNATLFARAEAAGNDGAIAPIVAAREAVRAIGPDIAIIDEAIATMACVRGFLSSHSPDQYSSMRGGALGWAMPASVGCSLGRGRAPVVCLVGDGAALYSPQTLWTAAHEALPVTFVVMNNGEYNVLKSFMRGQAGYASAHANRFIAMDINDPSIDYVALARGFGVPARRIERAGDVAPAIEAGIASGAANLVEIMIGT